MPAPKNNKFAAVPDAQKKSVRLTASGNTKPNTNMKIYLEYGFSASNSNNGSYDHIARVNSVAEAKQRALDEDPKETFGELKVEKTRQGRWNATMEIFMDYDMGQISVQGAKDENEVRMAFA